MNLERLTEGEVALAKPSQEILQALRALPKNKLGKTLSVKAELLDSTYERYKHFGKQVSPAIELYSGMTFKQLTVDDKNIREYLAKHLIIISALYGPIGSEELIAPYRLDMQAKLQIGGQSLASFWKAAFANALEDSDGEIINLASNEFSTLLPHSKNWVDIDIAKIVDGQIKRHSTTAKKARGQILQYMAEHKIDSSEGLKCLRGVVEYVAELSTKEKLFFKLNA